MKKTLSLYHVFIASKVLEKISTQDFPISIAYKFAKNRDAIMKEVDHIEEQRTALVKKMGEQVDADNYKVSEEKLPEFQKTFMEFLNKETVDLNVLQFSLEALEKTDVKISPNDLEIIYFMFDDVDVEFEDEVQGEVENESTSDDKVVDFTQQKKKSKKN